MDLHLFSQYLLSGIVIGIIYSLMALGITFIYGIMKMINWSMGEFYMIGSYVQYALLASVLGWDRWYLALPLSMASVFVLGVIVQRFLLRPMYVGGIERRDEYATIITIALMVLFRNLAIVLGGPNQYSPKDYAKPTTLLTLPISGNRVVALVGALVLLALFYVLTRRTWLGRAFRGAAQNRVGIQTAGVDVLRLDMLAFGVGVALAAAAGALLAPDFLVYPENGAISTFKGFEIIVIGGLGSIMGSVVGGLLLGVIEALGSVFLSPAYKDLYGFVLLIVLLAVRPTGLFGERERTVSLRRLARQPPLAAPVLLYVAVALPLPDAREPEVELLDVLVLGDARAVAVEHHAAVLHDVGVLGDAERHRGVLLGQQHGEPLFPVQPAHDLEDLGHQHGREAHRRLVEEHEPGMRHERPADGEHLLLAARDIARVAAPALAQAREVLVHQLEVAPQRRRPFALRVGAREEVLLHRQVLEDVAPLHDLDDAARDHLIGVLPVDRRRRGIRCCPWSPRLAPSAGVPRWP